MKKYIITIITILLLFFIIIYKINDNKVPVLTFHDITDKETSSNQFVKPVKEYEREINYLHKHHYHTMSMKEFDCWKHHKCKKAHKSVLITFDDGYMNNYSYAFKILKKYQMSATVFVIGYNLNNQNNGMISSNIIDKCKKEYPNITFASHSYNLHEDLNFSKEKFEEDNKKMQKVLKTKYYAYPHGYYTNDYEKELKKNKYSLAFNFGYPSKHRKADINDNNYEIPRLNIYSGMPDWKYYLRLIIPY
jgi:peptidoglycan/xylan/chitin deacetylase (PgdA/CDA1 family)